MRQGALLFSFIFSLSSCGSCESCSKNAADGDASTTAPADAPSATPATPATTPAATTTAPPEAVDPKFACRTLAREITTKACSCPQKNNAGCCLFGAPPPVPDASAPYVDCSRGKTNWPEIVESRLCGEVANEKKAEAFAACWAARGKLQCGRTPQGDLGAQLPKDCERLFK